MLFNSIPFFIFLIPVFLFFWKTSAFSVKTGHLVLLISSYIFYGWWDWRFLILIVISSTADFIIGKYLFVATKKSLRLFLLTLSIFINIGILFFFKYFNFFIDSLKIITGAGDSWNSLQIILPVGISFYTFQTMSYTIDIYREKTEPTKSALTFFTFVAFFPQLVAGPIERARNLIPQFEKKPVFKYEQASSGLKLMLWGLFKKMVIADQLAILVEPVYSHPENFGSLGIAAATVLFGFQIYCDFSGYSDIAIGTARLFGIELMINFKTPYFAHSFRSFWHRWHISLSTWFRDYLYIPLGGNQGNSLSLTRNILITFIVSGIWHGANVTFLIWGAMHGFLYSAEKFISPFFNFPQKIKNALGWVFTFILVNFLWLFFRAESWTHIKMLLLNLFSKTGNGFQSFSNLVYSDNSFTAPGRMLVFIFPLFIATEIFLNEKTFAQLLPASKRFYRVGLYSIILLVILFFGVLNSAPQFIYFQF